MKKYIDVFLYISYEGCCWLHCNSSANDITDAGSGTFHSLLQTSGENANCDSVEPSTSSGIIKDTKDSSCNCGRGRAKNDPDRKFCKQIVRCMPSRCMCYINMKGCSFKCHCSHCDNPYGTSDNAKASYTLT